MKKYPMLIGILLLCFLVSFCIINNKYLYRRHVDIDLNSGVCRYRYYYWFVPLKTNVIETEYSKLVQPYIITKEPLWYNDVKVGNFYSYYNDGIGFTEACHEFALLLKLSNYDESKRKELIQKSLGILKERNIKDFEKYNEDLSSCIKLSQTKQSGE